MRRRERTAGREDSLSGRAFGGAVWGTVQTVIMLPVNFVGSLLIARLLGPGDLGEFVALMVFLAISAPFLDFGFGAAMQQWAGRAVAAGDHAHVEAIFRKALGFHLLVQQPGILIAAAFLLRESPAYYFWAFAVLSVVGSSLGSVDYWLAAHNRLAMGARRALATGILGNIVLVAVAAAGGTPEMMWISRFAVQLLPAFAVLFALSPGERGILLRPLLPRRMPEGFWQFARPMWLTVLLGAVLGTRSEVFLLQWNDLAVEAGLFAVAFGLAIQVTNLFSGLHSSFGAAAVTLSGESEERLARALARGHSLFSILASLALAAAAGLPHIVAPLYGEVYAPAASILLPLVMAATLQTSLAAYGAGALVRRQRRRLLVTQTVAVILDVGLAATLVPVLGLSGAAAGAAAGLVAVNVGLLTVQHGARTAASLIVLGPWMKACMALGVAVAVTTPVPDGWLSAVAASALALGMQIVLLRVFHQKLLRELSTWLAPRLPRAGRFLIGAMVPDPRETETP